MSLADEPGSGQKNGKDGRGRRGRLGLQLPAACQTPSSKLHKIIQSGLANCIDAPHIARAQCSWLARIGPFQHSLHRSSMGPVPFPVPFPFGRRLLFVFFGFSQLRPAKMTRMSTCNAVRAILSSLCGSAPLFVFRITPIGHASAASRGPVTCRVCLTRRWQRLGSPSAVGLWDSCCRQPTDAKRIVFPAQWHLFRPRLSACAAEEVMRLICLMRQVCMQGT
jgi:hypothetical protein